MVACGWIIILLVLLCIGYLLLGNTGNCDTCGDKKYEGAKIEGYNEQSGRYCPTCSGKTINECLRCFNCGFLVDKWGNSGCVGGDQHGPYNYEDGARWYHIDGYSMMEQLNKDYKCSYGPRSSNRLIGV